MQIYARNKPDARKKTVKRNKNDKFSINAKDNLAQKCKIFNNLHVTSPQKQINSPKSREKCVV